jgi:hypothetical protein
MGQCIPQFVPRAEWMQMQIQIDIPKERSLLEFLQQVDDRCVQVTEN